MSESEEKPRGAKGLIKSKSMKCATSRFHNERERGDYDYPETDRRYFTALTCCLVASHFTGTPSFEKKAGSVEEKGHVGPEHGCQRRTAGFSHTIILPKMPNANHRAYVQTQENAALAGSSVGSISYLLMKLLRLQLHYIQ